MQPGSIFSNLTSTMHLPTFLASLFASLALAAFSSALADHHCGTTFDEPGGNDDKSFLYKRQSAPAPPAIPLYIHVVAGSHSRADGYVTEQEVLDQVSSIRSSFAPYGIKFTHTPDMRDWTVNRSRAGLPSDKLFSEMVPPLRKGDYSSLNLYIFNMPPGFLGLGSLPQRVATEQDACFGRCQHAPGELRRVAEQRQDGRARNRPLVRPVAYGG